MLRNLYFIVLNIYRVKPRLVLVIIPNNPQWLKDGVEMKTRERVEILPGMQLDKSAKSELEKENKGLWNHGIVLILKN